VSGLPQVGIDDLRAAARRIAPYVHRTPLLRSRTLERELGCEVYCKCENLQKVGAFKARGAVNAVLLLDEAAAAAGVVTHSSGNHAAALAYAAQIRGARCTVVMPEDAPAIKRAAVRGYGAEIVPCRRAERERACNELIEKRGLTLVHPFEDRNVVAGAGTAALELLEDVPELDLLIAPIGGGGLLAGSAIAVRALAPTCGIVGAEPEAVDDASRSFQTGVRQPTVHGAQTVADGLMTGIGALNFAILRQHEAEIVTVGEAAILEAAHFFLFRTKLVVEPSSATVLAALRRLGPRLRGLRIGAILSGGNTDFSWLAR
jgi:threonine dehydratase